MRDQIKEQIWRKHWLSLCYCALVLTILLCLPVKANSDTAETSAWVYPKGQSDMSSEIQSRLDAFGYCHLAPGIFYIGTGIDMPSGSSLVGCGKNTILRLSDLSAGSYILKTVRRNTIRDICFSGAADPVDLTISQIKDVSAINFSAKRDGTERNEYPCIIEGCWFENILGSAILCHNTGGGIADSILCSNCYIENCTAGINIDYYSEYHKFTNVIASRCHYACINNGGNNSFSSCTFHGTVCFLIDNSKNNKPNDSHGTAVGCTFNHADNWNRPDTAGGGDAILIKNASFGYIFSNCQIWYGKISVLQSNEIMFSNCLIGGNPKVEVTGTNQVLFASCIFHDKPVLSVSNSTCFENCFYRSERIAAQSSVKKKNPMNVTVKPVSVKKSRKKVTVSAKKVFDIYNAQGKVTYQKTSGSDEILVGDNGKITVKKKTDRGKYKIKVTVTASGDDEYEPGTKNVTVKVQVN